MTQHFRGTSGICLLVCALYMPAARGIPPPPLPSLAFHLALSMFRIAAILAGVGARAAQGNASSAHAAQVSSCRAVWQTDARVTRIQVMVLHHATPCQT